MAPETYILCTISSDWAHRRGRVLIPKSNQEPCPVPFVDGLRTGGRDVAEEVHGGPVQRDRAAAGGRPRRARDRTCPEVFAAYGAGDPRGTTKLPRAAQGWPGIIHDLGLGHPLKFLWGEKAQSLTTYSNFWKQFYRKFPQYRQATVTARDFEPGERVEVDYAGDTLEWIDLSTGEIRKVSPFGVREPLDFRQIGATRFSA